MALLRRGNIRVPHKAYADIMLTRLNGDPVRIMLNDLSGWEEFHLSKSIAIIVIVYVWVHSIAVRETFEQIDELVNGKAVANAPA